MDESQREEVALFRHGLLFPVLRGELGRGQLTRFLEEMADKYHDIPYSERTKISVSTLKRWRARYRESGFDGLKPISRSDRGQPRAIPEKVLELACQLRLEQSMRSVQQIIEMLERNGDIEPGTVKRSTLSRHLRRKGFAREHLKDKEEEDPGIPYRRFEAGAPNDLWQSDVKYGPYLPDPKDPTSLKRTYLVGFIDDFSRKIVHAEFYWYQDLVSLGDCCKKAMLRAGAPVSIYVDHGKIYISPRFEAAAAALGPRIITGQTYHPEGRGKIERLWGEVTRNFLAEADLLDITTLDELNDYLDVWIAEHHNQRVHSETKQTPQERFSEYLHEPETFTQGQLNEAFLWRDERTVQKTATISFEGNQYQVDPVLVGEKVAIYYDPLDLETLRVHHNGSRYSDAQPVDISRGHHPDVARRDRGKDQPSTGLNYLQLLKKERQQRRESQLSELKLRELPEEE